MDAARADTADAPAANTQAKPLSKTAKAADMGGKEKRRVVRRDPEKRRLQNIQAQKKYRDKLRKRLDNLEALAASVAESRQAASETTKDAPRLVASDILQTSTPAPTVLDWTSPGSTETQIEPTADPTVPTQVPLSTPHTTEPPWDLSLWDSKTFLDPAQLTYGKHSQEKQDDRWYTKFIDCGCSVHHVEIQSKPNHQGRSESLKRISFGGGRLPADPYYNNIRLEAVCTIAAMWSNSLHIGLSEQMFLEEYSVSPFYRSLPGYNLLTNGVSPSEESTVRTVQNIFRTLKPDLRPLREQVMMVHHPVVDIMPFPTLRRNILLGMFSVMEDEFCEDMMEGLVCWGGAGAGRRDREGATGTASTGTPWDSRSWEAKPWFLRKYWALLGGDDGEIARQSGWWRSVRGEEEDIWSCAE